MTLYSHRDSNVRKTWLLFFVFLIVVMGVGWALSYVYNDQSILYIAVVLSVGMNLIAYWKSDSIALTLSHAKFVEHDQNKDLYHIVENLCITAGLPTPKIYIISDPSPNAFATGRNPNHAAIALTTGLLERLDRSELEGVIAHELSHVRNYDTLLQTVVVVLVGLISIIADFFTRSMWFGGRDSDDRGGKNPVMLAISIAAIVIAPIAATLIQLAISRKREFLADASGALLTRYPEGLAGALEKISSAQPIKYAHNATAHLFFANPFKADAQKSNKVSFVAKLFMTHPPIQERIKMLRNQ
ncbi:MAG TPA: M48 family metalloprotease [Candidatus Paceibacterota bacterium]|nr:M48 family metalloprotease [Candidatus Paceibacterota bacterium]